MIVKYGVYYVIKTEKFEIVFRFMWYDIYTIKARNIWLTSNEALER